MFTENMNDYFTIDHKEIYILKLLKLQNKRFLKNLMIYEKLEVII